MRGGRKVTYRGKPRSSYRKLCSAKNRSRSRLCHQLHFHEDGDERRLIHTAHGEKRTVKRRPVGLSVLVMSVECAAVVGVVSP